VAERHNPHEMEEPSPKRQKTLEMEPDEEDADERDGVPDKQLAEPVLYHFKIKYDQTWDYKKICDRFFEKSKPYLCNIEHLNEPNTHVHFQGWSTSSHNTMKARITRLVKKHHLRKFDKNCRPSSMKDSDVTERGFQYMCKEVKLDYVLARNMFTDEEILQLKAQSVEHVKKLKTSVRDKIAGWNKEIVGKLLQQGIDSANDLIEQSVLCLIRLSKIDKFDLPEYNKHHTRASVIRGLMANPHLPEKWHAKLYSL